MLCAVAVSCVTDQNTHSRDASRLSHLATSKRAGSQCEIAWAWRDRTAESSHDPTTPSDASLVLSCPNFNTSGRNRLRPRLFIAAVSTHASHKGARLSTEAPFTYLGTALALNPNGDRNPPGSPFARVTRRPRNLCRGGWLTVLAHRGRLPGVVDGISGLTGKRVHSLCPRSVLIRGATAVWPRLTSQPAAMRTGPAHSASPWHGVPI